MIIKGVKGTIFIYSCSAYISFEIDCFYSLWTRIYEYGPPHPPIIRPFYALDDNTYNIHSGNRLKIDNDIIFIKMLWEGKVTKEDKDEDTTSIHNLNQKIHKDERVDNSFLPLADGLNLARKIWTVSHCITISTY